MANHKIVRNVHKWLLLVFYSMSFNLNGQTLDPAFEVAMEAICQKDTAKYLQIIQDYIDNKSGEKQLSVAYFLQSLAYEKTGANASAILSLEQALANYQGYMNLQYKSDTCDWIDGWNCAYFTDYCLLTKIAQLCRKEGEFAKALAYLDKTNRVNVFGYHGCVNGERMFETILSMDKAQCFLGLGDTLSAINLLVDYCIFNEGSMSEQSLALLKVLLYSQYSKDYIIEEIENSIKNVKTIKRTYGDYQEERVEYTLFGRKIPLLFMNLKEFQFYMTNNKNLAFLKE